MVIGVFVLPGFITLLFRERTDTVRAEDNSFDRLLLALFYSAIVYALALPAAAAVGITKDDIIDLYEGRQSIAQLGAAGAAVSLLIPAAVTLVGTRWRSSINWRPRLLTRIKVSPAHGVRSGWNAMFSRPGTAMVRVTLKDGGVVGGYYGPGSLAGYSEHEGDLFIAERWALDQDGWFVEPAEGSLGIWVPKDNIAAIHLYAKFGPPPTVGSAAP